ncbi:unnamed protein product [Trichobilharzia szidati]|nr:unnamed protein product [Trichobilharzia szidati]
MPKNHQKCTRKNRRTIKSTSKRIKPLKHSKNDLKSVKLSTFSSLPTTTTDRQHQQQCDTLSSNFTLNNKQLQHHCNYELSNLLARKLYLSVTNNQLPREKFKYHQSIFSKWTLDPIDLSLAEKSTNKKLMTTTTTTTTNPSTNQLHKLKQKRFSVSHKHHHHYHHHKLTKVTNEFQHTDDIDYYIMNYRQPKLLEQLKHACNFNDTIMTAGEVNSAKIKNPTNATAYEKGSHCTNSTKPSSTVSSSSHVNNSIESSVEVKCIHDENKLVNSNENEDATVTTDIATTTNATITSTSTTDNDKNSKISNKTQSQLNSNEINNDTIINNMTDKTPLSDENDIWMIYGLSLQ